MIKRLIVKTRYDSGFLRESYVTVGLGEQWCKGGVYRYFDVNDLDEFELVISDRKPTHGEAHRLRYDSVFKIWEFVDYPEPAVCSPAEANRLAVEDLL